MTTAAFTFPTSQYGVEAGLVADALSELKEGESIGYEALSKVAGINVLCRRNIINSARRALLKTQQKVYKAVNGFGLIRLDNEQLASSGVETIKRVGRMARRGIKVASATDYERLSPEGKTRHMVGLTVLNMVQHSSAESTIKKIGTTVQSGTRVLPLKEMLQMMAT